MAFTMSATMNVTAAHVGRRGSGVATRGGRTARFPVSGRTGGRQAVLKVRASAAEGAGEGFAEAQVFPRTKERDPYRRLGISKEATYEEVQDARNYLVDHYESHTAGVEAIEQAFDKIIQQKLKQRKKTKGLKVSLKKKKEGEDYTPPFIDRVKNAFERPDNNTIMRRAVLYAMISAWAVVQSSTSGPAFQMAVAFGLCVYFLNEKRAKMADKPPVWKSMWHTLIALIIGWLVGSLVPVYFPIFPTMMSPELILSLFSFIAFFITCTFLK